MQIMKKKIKVLKNEIIKDREVKKKLSKQIDELLE